MKFLHINAYIFVVSLFILAGCQTNSSPDLTSTSPKISDDGLQELQEITNEYLSAQNIIRTEGGRELDTALIINPTSEDFNKYPNYRHVGKTQSGIEYMFLVGDHATDISYEAAGLLIFSKSSVPNNPDCRGDASASNRQNKSYYECTFDLIMECAAGVTTIKIDGEYHTYSNCS